MPQEFELLEKEDPYSYYRGQSDRFVNLTPEERVSKTLWIVLPIAVASGVGFVYYQQEEEKKKQVADAGSQEQTLTNWSGNHTVTTKRFFQPETLTELEEVVQRAHRTKTRLRVVGSGLSPNGIGFDAGGMVSLAHMDKVISVDKSKMQVTVQAGARVSQVLDALRPHGLTLQNLASISEQQIGGFLQVSAHGTGATLPPVDEQVVSMTLVTPALGTITVARGATDHDAKELWRLGRVGLGALGVVAEVTLQCVPAHRLRERTTVLTRAEVRQGHSERLGASRHVRYMWIPFADAVVVVTCDPLPPWWNPATWSSAAAALLRRVPPPSEQVLPMRQLLATVGGPPAAETAGLSIAQLRDELLRIGDPLSTEHVRRVNQAEAECWRRSQGERVEWSDAVLGFECGGQQLVCEVAFPAIGPAGQRRDLEYVERLLALIEARDVPAASPLEQRWTAPSTSAMSPASALAADAVPAAAAEGGLFSWLGIIMYLPAQDGPARRAAIEERFTGYKALCDGELWDSFGCQEHWAKVDPAPRDPARLARIRARIQRRFPLGEFKALRERVDPHGVLANDLVRRLLDP